MRAEDIAAETNRSFAGGRIFLGDRSSTDAQPTNGDNDMNVHNMKDLMVLVREEAEEKERELQSGRGIWKLDRKWLVLSTNAGGYTYEIDLERCTTSAQVLDWIMQLAGKSWMTPEGLGQLVLAFDFILRPQAQLCSGGQEQGPIDVRKVVGERSGARAEEAA